MIIHRVPRNLVFGKRLQILPGQFESACDARVNVVALLKVNVFKEIAAYRSCGDGVAVHVDPGQLRNRTFHWHQSLAQVLVNSEVYLRCRHSQDLVSPSPFASILDLESRRSTTELYRNRWHVALRRCRPYGQNTGGPANTTRA